MEDRTMTSPRKPLETHFSRRSMLGASAAGLALASGLAAQEPAKAALKGNIRHSVCRWCYGKMSMDDLARECARIGLEGIDLVGTGDWEILKAHGLIGTMTPSHGIAKGLNRKENHEECLGKIRDAIDKTSAEGWPNVICFSGNRGGMSEEEGLVNCAEALKQIVGHAAEKNVTICMELLNSKSHKDYMCDHTAWGVELCKRVGSPNFKLLYDIYHMQRMEGDVIQTIRESKEFIGHYHTAGVPGRNEIDDTQELYYPAIMRAIRDTGFQGIVAQEFNPKRDPIASLEQSIAICDV